MSIGENIMMDAIHEFEQAQTNAGVATDALRSEPERLDAGRMVITYHLSAPLPDGLKISPLAHITLNPAYPEDVRIEAGMAALDIINSGTMLSLSGTPTPYELRDELAKSDLVPEKVRIAAGLKNVDNARETIPWLEESRLLKMTVGTYPTEVKTTAGRKFVNIIFSRYESDKATELLNAIVAAKGQVTQEVTTYAEATLTEIKERPVKRARSAVNDRRAPEKYRINCGRYLISELSKNPSVGNLNELVSLSSLFKYPSEIARAAEKAAVDMFEALPESDEKVAALRKLVKQQGIPGYRSDAFTRAKSLLAAREVTTDHKATVRKLRRPEVAKGTAPKSTVKA